MRALKKNRKLFWFLIIFIFFFTAKIYTHYNLQTTYFDHYYFDNPLWNTAEGRPLFLTVEQRSFLANHFSPVLFLFALPYFIYPTALWIFALQALFTAGIAFFVLAFAEIYLDEKGQKLIVLLILTSLPIRYMGLHDFHMDIVIAFLISAALYFLLVKEWFALPVILMAGGFLAKETAGFVIAGFGLYLTLISKFSRKLTGIFLVLFGIGGMVLIVKEVIPQFSALEHYMFSSYYSHFGSNISEQAANILFNPLKALGFIFSAENILYFVLLLIPFAFLPLFSCQIMAIDLLPFLQNLLSNYHFQKNIITHYQYILMPVLFIAAILSINEMQKDGRWLKVERIIKPVIIFFAAASIIAFIIFDLRAFIPQPKVFSAHRIMRLVPRNASLSASGYLLTHLLYRERLYLFPRINKADYVIFEDIDRNLPKGSDIQKFRTLWKQKQYGQFVAYIFLGIRNPKEEYSNAIEAIKKDRHYKLISAEHGIYLFRRRDVN